LELLLVYFFLILVFKLNGSPACRHACPLTIYGAISLCFLFLSLFTESKNDGAVEAEDSEDDWTFNDYRSGAAEQSKEESAIGEGGDNSSVVEVTFMTFYSCHFY